MEITTLFSKRCTPQKTYMRSIWSSGVGKCLLVRSRGRGINTTRREKNCNSLGVYPGGEGGMVLDQIEPCIILICNSSFETRFEFRFILITTEKKAQWEHFRASSTKNCYVHREPKCCISYLRSSSWVSSTSFEGIWIRSKMVYTAGFLSGTWQSRLKFPLLLTILWRHSCVSIEWSREENRVLFCLFSSFPRRVSETWDVTVASYARRTRRKTIETSMANRLWSDWNPFPKRLTYRLINTGKKYSIQVPCAMW